MASVEVDLYKKTNDTPENSLSLSSTFLSLRFNPVKRLSLSASYDNRKNVIYYETYKSYINQIIDIEARQGISFQVSYYTLENISFGIKTGYRFQIRTQRNQKIYMVILPIARFPYSDFPPLWLQTILKQVISKAKF